MTDDLAGAEWIARPVPPSTRIVRSILRDRIGWAAPGSQLAQSFTAPGPLTAVNVDLVGPEEGPHTTDVRFSLVLETHGGDIVAERVFDGPQLVWDYFGPLLGVSPPAPAGDYRIVLRAERGTIGWSIADAVVAPPSDDGVSPLPLIGVASVDDIPVPGVRMVGVDTLPAPNPMFRRIFDLPAAPRSARLTAVVLGTGVIRVNGSRVGDEALEPAVTDYDKTVLYRTWDVVHLLRAGENEIVLEAGRERYSARGGDVWGWSLAPWHREPVALAALRTVDADGAVATVVTDERWQCAPGPVAAERLFRGEDWVLGGPAPTWSPATVVAAPSGTLRPASAPPVRAGAPLPPRQIEPLAPQRTVFDFGQALVGRIHCRITGSAGAVVRVRAGEQRTADGEVVCDNTLVAGEAQLDTVELAGDVEGVAWEPQFGYRGFRWLQVETSGEVTVDDVRAVPLYADIDTVGEFRADEPVIEWIDAATARTFRNNLHGIPTDTPIYEKNGWTADAHLATEGLLHHVDLRAAFGKWMDDHIDAQAADGSVPQIIPTPGWGRASDPTWSSSAVLIPWYLYREYGDPEILRRTEGMIRRFADQVVRSLDGGIWRRRSWGDWLAPHHQIGPEGMAPIGTIMTVTVLQHTAAVLRELDCAHDAAEYAAEAASVAAAYHAEFFDPRLGHHRVEGVGYRQVLDILPLAFDAVPAAHVHSVRAALVRDLEERTDGHLDTGAVGVRHLLPVLSAAGRDDLAVTVLTRRSAPGWGAWYVAGDTTLRESWDPDARSRNHYFLGSVDSWIQQRVGGLRLTEPGWRAFEISPVEDPRVTRARIAHRTPRGTARVHWHRGAGGWRFVVTVPDGATACIRVAADDRQLGAGEHVLHVPAGGDVIR